jgi:hypothetical protein
MNLFIRIVLLFLLSDSINSCQTKKNINVMNDKNINGQVASTDRLLSVANLELADSSSRVIAWFFETPQIFEFKMGSEQSLLIFSLLKEAKEKQLPLNVRSTAVGEKNIIEKVSPATNEQIEKYKKEKAQQQQPIKINKPPHN